MLLVGLGQVGRLFGSNTGVFPSADEIQQVAGTQYGVGHLDFAQHASGNALLIASIVYGELSRITQMLNLPPQYAHAKGMESRDFRSLF